MTGLFALLIFIFAFEKGFISIFLKYKVFLFFGKLSYSMYMIHVFILFSFSWLILIFENVFNLQLRVSINSIIYIDLGLPLYNNILIFFLLSIILYISTFTHKYIEQRGQVLGKKLRKYKRIKGENKDA
ncbi:acyltransferase [hydrothermal vent metagenome]|uniref:Acyltransferase n=1 Tax=hydrothermal vent metagenome TaxID=652676 RepID=A0A1W1D1T4_9ZZZZ